MERRVKGAKRSGKVPNPYTIKIANETIVAKSIVFLDESKRLFDAAQNGLGFKSQCYPNPEAVNSPPSRKAKFEPFEKAGTLGLPHVITYDTGRTLDKARTSGLRVCGFSCRFAKYLIQIVEGSRI